MSVPALDELTKRLFVASAIPHRTWISGTPRFDRPIHCETEKHHGFDSALQMVTASQGRFRFEPQPETIDRTIEASVTELLLDMVPTNVIGVIHSPCRDNR